MQIKNKIYFVDLIPRKYASKFTKSYHYSGISANKSKYNLGVFRISDKKLVGVLQWGVSFQKDIRLDRYVKENISLEEYLELNRFCMADSEGKNAESQAISLGIKWIKKFHPEIKLLVSYAGRKEGNYGYIYQATNWEYLGYFLSSGFWFVDGEEKHKISLWFRTKKYGNEKLGFLDNLKFLYEDVRETLTKQFIYIIRLDKTLTLASEILPYPKPLNEFPIKTKEKIHKQNEDIFNSYRPKERVYIDYYWEPYQEYVRKYKNTKRIAVYNAAGFLEFTANNINAINIDNYTYHGIYTSIKTGKRYKNNFFREFDIEPEDKIEVSYLCEIDGIPFLTFSEVGRYLNVSKQAVAQAKKRKALKIAEKDVIWINE